jgi:hypothetical protein
VYFSLFSPSNKIDFTSPVYSIEIMGASESTPTSNLSSRYSVTDQYQPNYYVTSLFRNDDEYGDDCQTTTPTKSSQDGRYLSTTQTPPAYKRFHNAIPSTQTPPAYKRGRYSSSSTNNSDDVSLRRTFGLYDMDTPVRELKFDPDIHGRGGGVGGWWPGHLTTSRYASDIEHRTKYGPTDTIPFGMETSYGPTDTMPLYNDDDEYGYDDYEDVFRYFNPVAADQGDTSAVQSVRRSFSSSINYDDYSPPSSPTRRYY